MKPPNEEENGDEIAGRAAGEVGTASGLCKEKQNCGRFVFV